MCRRARKPTTVASATARSLSERTIRKGLPSPDSSQRAAKAMTRLLKDRNNVARNPRSILSPFRKPQADSQSAKSE